MLPSAETVKTEAPEVPQVKRLSGDTVNLFLNFRADVLVHQALKASAVRDGVSVETMCNRILSHSLGFEVPL